MSNKAVRYAAHAVHELTIDHMFPFGLRLVRLYKKRGYLMPEIFFTILTLICFDGRPVEINQAFPDYSDFSKVFGIYSSLEKCNVSLAERMARNDNFVKHGNSRRPFYSATKKGATTTYHCSQIIFTEENLDKFIP